MNMVRCLLVEGKMPGNLWAEAAKWSVHIINRSLTATITNKTPEECWTGNKPNVAHFRVFGCVAYAHIPDVKRIKLEDKSHKCVNSWEVFQLDVKSVFLHGELNEVVYIEQPEGYIRRGEEHKAYLLKKALYGLKQAPRAYYSRLEDYFAGEGFDKCNYEQTLFIKKEGGSFFVVSLYVDDLIFTGNNVMLCEKFKASMQSEFDMTDIGRMKYFLGIKVHQTEAGIFLCQGKYENEILARFGMSCCNAVNNPMVPGTKLSSQEKGEEIDSTEYKQLIGSLMYITTT